jgi:hypothetical protein
MGFNAGKRKMVSRLTPGARLLCYLTKASVFVGELEVTGKCFENTQRIWSDGLFPIRLPVRVVVELPLSRSVPIRTLAGKLSFMPKATKSTSWTTFVRSSPRRWPAKDCAAVTRAILKAHASGLKTHRDQSPSGLWPLPSPPKQILNIPQELRVGRVVRRTVALQPDEKDSLGSYESVLSYNKVTGYSVNFPIALTCRPTAVCAKTCYFAHGGPSWTPALRRQLRLYSTVRNDPQAFARRVVKEYDSLGLSFLRWNGGGDLFEESVTAINCLAKERPDIVLWVVTRTPEWAARIKHWPNVFIHISLDRHSLQRREQFLKAGPLSTNYFFSYQCDANESPSNHVLNGISVLFFDNYIPTSDCRALPADVVCPLNRLGEIRNACESCRRCFDGSAVAHSRAMFAAPRHSRTTRH